MQFVKSNFAFLLNNSDIMWVGATKLLQLFPVCFPTVHMQNHFKLVSRGWWKASRESKAVLHEY